MTCFIADISRTGEATNELFDLAYRHLAAAQIILRPLAVPPALASEQADQRSSLLSKVQMFEVLDGDEVRELASRLSRHEYEASQTIVTADQVIDYLLIVASGVLSVMVHRENPGQPDEKIEIARLGPEDSFGESGVLSGVPMSVDITAMSRVLVYRLDKEDLSPLLKKRPELGHRCVVFYRNVGTTPGRLFTKRSTTSKRKADCFTGCGKACGVCMNWLRRTHAHRTSLYSGMLAPSKLVQEITYRGFEFTHVLRFRTNLRGNLHESRTLDLIRQCPSVR